MRKEEINYSNFVIRMVLKIEFTREISRVEKSVS